MSVAKCETGWGDGHSTRTLLEWRDRHPTPPLTDDASHRRIASTLPLQGRVSKSRALNYHVAAPR
jgi:hypothetical protein